MPLEGGAGAGAGGAGAGLGAALGTASPALPGAVTPGPAPPPTPNAFCAPAEVSHGPVGAARTGMHASCATRGAKTCCTAERASGDNARRTPAITTAPSPQTAPVLAQLRGLPAILRGGCHTTTGLSVAGGTMVTGARGLGASSNGTSICSSNRSTTCSICVLHLTSAVSSGRTRRTRAVVRLEVLRAGTAAESGSAASGSVATAGITAVAARGAAVARGLGGASFVRAPAVARRRGAAGRGGTLATTVASPSHLEVSSVRILPPPACAGISTVVRASMPEVAGTRDKRASTGAPAGNARADIERLSWGRNSSLAGQPIQAIAAAHWRGRRVDWRHILRPGWPPLPALPHRERGMQSAHQWRGKPEGALGCSPSGRWEACAGEIGQGRGPCAHWQ